VIFAAIADCLDTDSYPVTFMCDQLGVSTSGQDKWRTREPSAHEREDATLTALIRAFFARLRGNPGVRRMHAELAVAGHRISRKRVWRLMQTAGLQGRHPRAWKKTTTPGEHPVPAPDLIGRSFTADRVNERWCGDITYIKTWDGWAYVATVIDLHSRALVGWAAADHMRTSLITDALDMAITQRRPPKGVIFHSDRGTHNTLRARSTNTAPITTFDDPWVRPGYVTTTPCPNLSSQLTRRNSFTPDHGQTSRFSRRRLSAGSRSTTTARDATLRSDT
jgi:putative transposase